MEVERLLGGRALALERQRYAPEGRSKKSQLWNLVVRVHRIALCLPAEAPQTPVSDNSAVTVATSKLLILAQEQLGCMPRSLADFGEPRVIEA
jgi:hypothetical protein